MTTLVAGPVIVTDVAVGGVSAPSVKVRLPLVGSVASVIVNPLKVATPDTAALVLRVNELPAPEYAAVTVEVSEVTMLPPESTTSTTGCGVSATPLTAPAAGAVAKDNFAAAPTETVTVLDAIVVGESVPSENVNV
jgi:hypothetical protein